MNKARTVALITAPLLLVGAAGAIALGNDEPTIPEIFANTENETSKEEIAAEDALLQRIGEENPAPVPENPEEAGPEPDPADFAWEEGIFDDAEFPIGLGYVFENRWSGQTDGWYVTAFAGSVAEDPSRGVVLIQLKDPESWGNRFEGPFEAPVLGPVHVASHDGLLVTLIGSDGASAVFDVRSMTFH